MFQGATERPRTLCTMTCRKSPCFGPFADSLLEVAVEALVSAVEARAKIGAPELLQARLDGTIGRPTVRLQCGSPQEAAAVLAVGLRARDSCARVVRGVEWSAWRGQCRRPCAAAVLRAVDSRRTCKGRLSLIHI